LKPVISLDEILPLEEIPLDKPWPLVVALAAACSPPVQKLTGRSKALVWASLARLVTPQSFTKIPTTRFQVGWIQDILLCPMYIIGVQRR
jgi:hypothetical protein